MSRHHILHQFQFSSVAQRSSPTQHLLGHTLPSQRQGYDSIYMTSTGKLTSHGPYGEFSWQVRSSFHSKDTQKKLWRLYLTVVGWRKSRNSIPLEVVAVAALRNLDRSDRHGPHKLNDGGGGGGGFKMMNDAEMEEWAQVLITSIFSVIDIR